MGRLFHNSAVCTHEKEWRLTISDQVLDELVLAADARRAAAEFLLGWLLLYMDGENSAWAAKVFRSPGRHGYSRREIASGLCMVYGIGVKADLQVGMRSFNPGTEFGNPAGYLSSAGSCRAKRVIQ
jgi:hypothetical protein